MTHTCGFEVDEQFGQTSGIDKEVHTARVDLGVQRESAENKVEHVLHRDRDLVRELVPV